MDEVRLSVDRFCLLAGIEALAEMMDDAAGADSTSVRSRSMRFSNSPSESATVLRSCLKAASLASLTSARLLENSRAICRRIKSSVAILSFLTHLSNRITISPSLRRPKSL